MTQPTTGESGSRKQGRVAELRAMVAWWLRSWVRPAGRDSRRGMARSKGRTTMRFKDKVCLVTGGGSGIGRATCELFGREGGKVVVVNLHEKDGNATVQAITQAGGEAILAQADVGVPDQVKAAVQTAIDKWGRIDVLVNDAAMMTFKPVVELSEQDWDRVLDVNLRAIFLFCKYALPHMQAGAIVNVSSVHAHETTANVSPYATSKGGMEAFTRALSREVAAQKVRVNCVAPGAVDTPMLWDNPNVQSGRRRSRVQSASPRTSPAASGSWRPRMRASSTARRSWPTAAASTSCRRDRCRG
ncbi:MAG: SDR family oxidoreductase [Chloroflexota bacterium]|nr:SDR family oxidoreductase [Chloroflexota bacterium]